MNRKSGPESLGYRRVCRHCRMEVMSSKPFMLYCSNACKQAAYRERKANAKTR